MVLVCHISYVYFTAKMDAVDSTISIISDIRGHFLPELKPINNWTVQFIQASPVSSANDLLIIYIFF